MIIIIIFQSSLGSYSLPKSRTDTLYTTRVVIEQRV